MKLEVLLKEAEPKIYSLDRAKIIVGSHENSHVVIHESSISRKHAIITITGDRFYVSDQGSINGTFVNDEKLVPGKRVEITIFSPVRLGPNVLLTLITEEEASELEEVLPLNDFEVTENEEPTMIVSFSELKKKHTEDLKRKRISELPKRKEKVRKKQQRKSSSLFLMIALISLLGFGIYKKMEKKFPIEKKQSNVISFKPVKTLSITSLLKRDFLIEAFQKHKCLSDLEKKLCVLLPSINQKNFGPVVIEEDIILFADIEQVANKAVNYLPEKEIEESDLYLMSLFIWIRENINDNLSKVNDIDNFRITIALMRSDKESSDLLMNAIFVPTSLLQFKNTLEDKHFESAKVNGISEFYYHLNYGKFSSLKKSDNKTRP